MSEFVARAVTRGPKHHFFGYYGIPPWNASGKYLLCLETDFQDHFPTAQEAATIGLVDLNTGCFEPLTTTHAWNFQQSAKLQWLPSEPENTIVFNERQGDRFVAVVMDIRTGKRRILPRAVSSLSRDGRKALCLSFSRLRDLFPTIGYSGIPDPYADEFWPDGDGIYVMDMETGEAELIVTFAQVRATHAGPPDMDEYPLYFTHATFNTDGSRFYVLSRYKGLGGQRRITGLFTARPDGSELRCVVDYLYASHLDWLDARQLLMYGDHDGRGPHYYLLDVESGEYRIIGEGVLTTDGHCVFSSDRRWFVTDTYPDSENRRALKLWNMAEEREVILGRYYSDPGLTGEIRCDLHPRWSRDDREICFDSIHEGSRQLYTMDVSSVTK